MKNENNSFKWNSRQKLFFHFIYFSIFSSEFIVFLYFSKVIIKTWTFCFNFQFFSYKIIELLWPLYPWQLLRKENNQAKDNF